MAEKIGLNDSRSLLARTSEVRFFSDRTPKLDYYAQTLRRENIELTKPTVELGISHSIREDHLRRDGHAGPRLFADRSRRRFLKALVISSLFWVMVLALFSTILKPGTYSIPTAARHPDIEITLETAGASRPAHVKTGLSKETPVPPAAAKAPEESAKPLTPLTSPVPAADASAESAAFAEAAPQSVTPPAASSAAPAPAGGKIGPDIGAGSAATAEATANTSAAAGRGDAPAVSPLSLLNTAIKNNLKYPPQARKRGIEGRVEVEISVSGAGALIACELIGTSGSGLLDEAALKLLRGLFPIAGGGDGFRTRVAIEYRLN